MTEVGQQLGDFPESSCTCLSIYGDESKSASSNSLEELVKIVVSVPIYTNRVSFCGLTDLLVVKMIHKTFITEMFPHFCHSIARQTAKPSLKLRQKVISSTQVRNGLSKSVLQDMKDPNVIDVENGRIQTIFHRRHERRAVEIYMQMRSTMSSYLLRFTGWILFKIFGRLLSSVDVSLDQIEQLRQLSQGSKGIPQIFLPLHRSHVDYILLTWVLWNFDLNLPNVAAGDNLRIPVFGHLMRNLGGFFIKRKLDPLAGKKDFVYRAVLQTYVEELLKGGESLEFFIEAGRSRTGKSLMPKAGLFSIVVESYLQGVIPDAHIIPVAMSYEKILDGNFIRELTGEAKKGETFWGALNSVWKTFRSKYGRVQIQFSPPISLKNLVASAVQHHCASPPNGYKMDSGDGLLDDRRHVDFRISNVDESETSSHELSVSFAHSDSIQLSPSSPSHLNNCGRRKVSTTSLCGPEDEHRRLIKSLCHHVVYDCTNRSAVMSTQAVAFLLLNNFRSGVEWSTLTMELDWLREEILTRGGNVGFSADSNQVVTEALALLGDHLITIEKFDNKAIESGYSSLADSPESSVVSLAKDSLVDHPAVIIRPNCGHPAVLELQYYSNAAIFHFQIDAVVAASLWALLSPIISSANFDSVKATLSRDELLHKCLQLCEVLQFEFVFHSLDFPSLESRLLVGIERFTTSLKQFLRRQSSDDSGTEEICQCATQPNAELEILLVESNLRQIRHFAILFGPILESYCAVVNCLAHLSQFKNGLEESKFVSYVYQQELNRLHKNLVKFPESVNVESIRSGLKLLDKWKIVGAELEGRSRLVQLEIPFADDLKLLSGVGQFLAEFLP